MNFLTFKKFSQIFPFIHTRLFKSFMALNFPLSTRDVMIWYAVLRPIPGKTCNSLMLPELRTSKMASLCFCRVLWLLTWYVLLLLKYDAINSFIILGLVVFFILSDFSLCKVILLALSSFAFLVCKIHDIRVLRRSSRGAENLWLFLQLRAEAPRLWVGSSIVEQDSKCDSETTTSEESSKFNCWIAEYLWLRLRISRSRSTFSPFGTTLSTLVAPVMGRSGILKSA